MTILISIVIYLCLIAIVSTVASRRAGNEAFFRGERRSNWMMVAFGMIGASVSGVTFVSVPGMVMTSGMTYLQTCMGFIVGYAVVAMILLPIYFKMNVTTIYTYLDRRMGRRSYKTGAAFFMLSKLTGTAVKFYLFCMLLHRFVVAPLYPTPISFPLTIAVMVICIWLYSRRGGIKTLVVTDVFQTACMLLALLIITYKVAAALDMNFGAALSAINDSPMSRIFILDDWLSPRNFWKQFVSGIFIVIVMTGLDQDMMQKNLTCKSLGEARKDMMTYGLAFVPVNWLFLALGILLTMLAAKEGLPLPAKGDELLPMFAVTGQLGETVVVLFTIGIMAASLSTADSALTSLTTSCCVDLLECDDDERLRKRVHMAMAAALIVIIILFHLINSQSLIDAVYTLVGYTYGPLLGLFAFALLTRYRPNDRLAPYICMASPIVCFIINYTALSTVGYRFGYELLMLNGLITFTLIYITKLK